MVAIILTIKSFLLRAAGVTSTKLVQYGVGKGRGPEQTPQNTHKPKNSNDGL
jgi:hypothetical protein